jgi:hypothetical protein
VLGNSSQIIFITLFPQHVLGFIVGFVSLSKKCAKMLLGQNHFAEPNCRMFFDFDFFSSKCFSFIARSHSEHG